MNKNHGCCAACNTLLTGPGWTAVAGRVCDRCSREWATVNENLTPAGTTRAARQERFNRLSRAWLSNYVDVRGRTWRDLSPRQIHHANSPCFQAFVASHAAPGRSGDTLDYKFAIKWALARLRNEEA